MRPLRRESARPELVVDDRAHRLRDPASGTYVGVPAPFGRERCLSTLPLDPGPVWLAGPRVLHDPDGGYLADPSGTLVGFGAVIVDRMLTARWTEDTRRLAG